MSGVLDDEAIGRIDGILQLAYAYEDKSLRAPSVHKCSHSTRLHLSDKHIREVVQYGTITLPPVAVIELIENLRERGN